jgi:hypothetical protein
MASQESLFEQISTQISLLSIEERLRLIQQLAGGNEVEQSWVTSGEMRQRLVKRGANVDSQYR